MKRVGLVSSAVVIYILAAWMVAPGFYDGGFAPSYNWVCPPPQAGQTRPAESGHLNIKVVDGVSDANSAYTTDGQAVISFLPGAFDATGRSTISVDVTPVTPCPAAPGLHFGTNVYLIAANAPLAKTASVVLSYSDVQPDPSFIYRSQNPDGPWQNIGSGQQAEFWTINTTTRELGYFAAGYPSNAVAGRSPASQVIPIVVAALIVIVLIAGIPLAVLRRRSASGPEDAGAQ